MPDVAPDFRLYHANDLDLLARLLAAELRAPVAGRPLLEPDVVLIPQAAMRRWLQATLADSFGIAANLEFLTPGEFVARALDANLGKADGDLDAAALHWRLYAALTDPALLALPALAPFAGCLRAGDALTAWSLAGELAAAFEKYQAWRRDWLLRWDAGADPDDPQAVLWRATMAGRPHRARRIQDYLARFERGDARPRGLPARLFAFATLNVSPDVLRVLATQARAGTLHLYVPNPVQGYWGDLQSLRAQLLGGAAGMALEEDNPLLRDWGAAGRDFMRLLGGYELVHPAIDLDVHVDPGARKGAGLLQRLQSDLFHRRAAPGAALRDGVALDDPSLQFHACHTRLRELEVLHDRLRALLDPASPEGRRFDPPLQPREIAVLAPDIDPYVPYLDAVFGDGEAAIPYALADASPLAGEPLAEVFLRLLDLPQARFGLGEVLDLLATPVLAEANGLAAADIDRLRGWLADAGARWGLDAGHRGRLGAPEDDASTWQFALDRLLLGHACGEDALFDAGDGRAVAAWSGPEGSALAVLDTLLRLLRQLARAARALGEPQPPAQWRERLLQLLDALLPQPPADAAGQRALERLRKLIDDVARQAELAGFAAPVPPEVVRAQFAAALGQADTRAPLLTGGVSFARMVPMRLLPFRVICLLGMNDGEFPRRDPAAGLSKLAAELASGQRQPGDRSTRDDDRFLFLQLLTAAQDVFYLSWLGADPRDGSAREPSSLVTELLAAAAAQHQDADATANALVLHQPLQPFARAAFGGGEAGEDPRAFSYRGHWHPAARQLSAARRRLAPWQPAGDALADAAGAEDSLALEALRGFLRNPADAFLRQRLQLRVPTPAAVDADLEPLQAPAKGLDAHALQQAVFALLLQDVPASAQHAQLRARGLLASGPLGRRVLDDLHATIAPYAQAYRQWAGNTPPSPLLLNVEIDGLRLHGRIEDARPGGIAHVRFGNQNGNGAIRGGLDWLLASAAGSELPLFEFHQQNAGIGPHPRAPLPQAQAQDALRGLLALRRDGLRQPLPFAPYSSWALFQAGDVSKGVRDAAKKWRGDGRGGFAEGAGEALRLALRGRDPFGDREALGAFAAAAGTVFGLLTEGVPRVIDTGAVALPACDDEDAE